MMTTRTSDTKTQTSSQDTQPAWLGRGGQTPYPARSRNPGAKCTLGRREDAATTGVWRAPHLDCSLDLGVCGLIDTSPNYGESERIVGRVVREWREHRGKERELTVVTKVGVLQGADLADARVSASGVLPASAQHERPPR